MHSLTVNTGIPYVTWKLALDVLEDRCNFSRLSTFLDNSSFLLLSAGLFADSLSCSCISVPKTWSSLPTQTLLKPWQNERIVLVMLLFHTLLIGIAGSCSAWVPVVWHPDISL